MGNTVVQTTYRPTIAPAVVGLIADGSLENVNTFICETVAGIGFGLAVAQGASDSGCILAASGTFIGVSVRDVTLALTPIGATSETANTLDKYGLYANVAVLRKGKIWVEAGHTVAAGNALAYDATGKFGTGTSGNAGVGTLTFTQQPAADATIVVGDVTHTFKASGAAGPQSNIGATLNDTLTAAAAVINASPGSAYDAINAVAYPPGGANQLRIAAAAVGTAGNALTITAGTSAGVTASAATLLGGTASSTAISGGRWETSAMAGELAIISI